MKYEFKDIKDVDLSKLEDGKIYETKTQNCGNIFCRCKDGKLIGIFSDLEYYVISVLLPCSPIVETDTDFCMAMSEPSLEKIWTNSSTEDCKKHPNHKSLDCILCAAERSMDTETKTPIIKNSIKLRAKTVSPEIKSMVQMSYETDKLREKLHEILDLNRINNSYADTCAKMKSIALSGLNISRLSVSKEVENWNKENETTYAEMVQELAELKKSKEVENILNKVDELAKEYESVLRKYNYQLKLNGDDPMDFQTLLEFRVLYNNITNK